MEGRGTDGGRGRIGQGQYGLADKLLLNVLGDWRSKKTYQVYVHFHEFYRTLFLFCLSLHFVKSGEGVREGTSESGRKGEGEREGTSESGRKRDSVSIASHVSCSCLAHLCISMTVFFSPGLRPGKFWAWSRRLSSFDDRLLSSLKCWRA